MWLLKRSMGWLVCLFYRQTAPSCCLKSKVLGGSFIVIAQNSPVLLPQLHHLPCCPMQNDFWLFPNYSSAHRGQGRHPEKSTRGSEGRSREEIQRFLVLGCDSFPGVVSTWKSTLIRIQSPRISAKVSR